MLKERNDFVFKKIDEEKYIMIKVKQVTEDNMIIAVISDISRIKDLESTGEKLVNIFFSTMAHQLKTPLNSILPLTE